MQSITLSTTLAAATAILLSGVATAQVSLDPGVNVVMGSQPSGAAFGDFDGDGDIDAATTVDGPDRVQVALNDGLGTYSLGPASLLGSSSSPQDVIAGDWDGDGLVDLAVAVRDPAGSVVIMRNLGGATFGVVQTVGVGDRPRGLDAADFDGDGDMDLAVVARDGNTAHVLTNSGGSFTAATLAAGAEPRKAAFGDFDADGDMDLAVTNHDDRTISIYTNTGAGFVNTATLPLGGIFRPEGLDATDLDGDGDADLVVGLSDDVVANVVGVLVSEAGAFSGPVTFPTGGLDSGQVALADLDCDGFLDAIVSNSTSSTVSVLPGLAGNSFGPPMIMAAGANPSELAVADIDNDGDLDVMVANGDATTITIFSNAGDCKGGGGGGPTPCPQDLNADGIVGFDDLLDVLTAWGPCDG
jgi:hypothetical protein